MSQTPSCGFNRISFVLIPWTILGSHNAVQTDRVLSVPLLLYLRFWCIHRR